MASQKQQYTILYGRLSQEDERAGESNSIQHQRDLLEKYARDKGFENTLFLADEGYSGTNFERPSWKKIVEMIEAGEVSTLIVKDASRLGREYLQVGYYMEIYFPQKNVRFIAVNDGVDSAVESSNDFNPIRNWANELHAKDTSRKVRAVKKLQAEFQNFPGTILYISKCHFTAAEAKLQISTVKYLNICKVAVLIRAVGFQSKAFMTNGRRAEPGSRSKACGRIKGRSVKNNPSFLKAAVTADKILNIW